MIWHQMIQADKLASNINTFSSQSAKLLVLQVPEWSWGGLLLLSGSQTFRAVLGQASKPIHQLTKLAAVYQIFISLWKGGGEEKKRFV